MNKVPAFVGALIALLGPPLPAQEQPNTAPPVVYDYLGQEPPGPTPVLFAPGVISTEGSRERSLSFSPKGDELFFTRGSGWPDSRIMHMRRQDGQWSAPEAAAFLKGDRATQAVFSPDGRSLYYSSSHGQSDPRFFSLWRSRKLPDGWSVPESVIDMGGGLFMEFHPSVTRDGSLYFLYWDFSRQTGDLYVASLTGGKTAAPVLLGPPISTPSNEVRPTVDPDGRYLLFESDRPGGLGGTDVYIAVKKDDGTWASPENLGTTVNTANDDDTPDISPDGRYWFFSRNGDIYWMVAPAALRASLHGVPQATSQPAQENKSIPEAMATVDRALARDLLRELVAIDTTPAVGSTKAAEAMAARLRAAGFADADLILLGPRPDRQNLVVRLRGRTQANPILLIAHLDVVDAPREGWASDPFQLTERDGRFYGRGVNDVKNAVASLVATLIRLRQERFVPDRDIIVALTADEESGNANGVGWLLRERRDLVDAAYCLNLDGGGGRLEDGKPVRLRVETCEKIYASFRAEATSPGGHSSLPTADNAIYRLAAALNRLAQFEFPYRFNETTRAYFERLSRIEKGPLGDDLRAVAKDPPDLGAAQRLAATSPFHNAILHTTAVATRVEAGHADNALPQSARAIINCRMFPGDTPESVQRALADALSDPEITVTSIGAGRESPVTPLLPEVLGPIEQLTGEMWPGTAVLPIMAPWATDSARVRRAGIPAFGVSGVFGAGDSDNTHGANERLLVASFYESNEFLYRLLKKLTASVLPPP